MDGWMDGWMDGRTDGRTDRRTGRIIITRVPGDLFRGVLVVVLRVEGLHAHHPRLGGAPIRRSLLFIMNIIMNITSILIIIIIIRLLFYRFARVCC